MTRPSFDEYAFALASVVSTRATCPRASVGTVIMRDGRVLSTGFNGSLSGTPHCTEVGCLMEGGHCIRASHSEQNAVSFAARHGMSLAGAVAYVTHQPCSWCVKALRAAGVVDIRFEEAYP